jgi:hypothetical protein
MEAGMPAESIDFLQAQIAEDRAELDRAAEAEAETLREDGMRGTTAADVRSYWLSLSPTETRWRRWLAECEAKRRIVGLHHDRTPADIIAEHIEDGESWTAECAECSCYGDCVVELPCPTLRALMLPYADRPGFRPEWQGSQP